MKTNYSLKRIRHFFGIYTKEEKFFNGYNTMIWAIKNKELDFNAKSLSFGEH